jgi:hypothetical protein
MVTFLKFTHRRMSPAEFRALEAVRHLRALANGLTPDARSKEPKEATFQNLPEHEELLRSVLAYCHKQPDKPQCITQVLLGMVLGPCAMTCGLPWSAILGRVGVLPLYPQQAVEAQYRAMVSVNILMPPTRNKPWEKMRLDGDESMPRTCWETLGCQPSCAAIGCFPQPRS